MSYPSFSEQMRILRSFDITVIRRSVEIFEAKNMLSGHVYRLLLKGSKVTCPCPDSKKGNHCKHAYAVERALEVFDGAEFGFSEAV